MASYRFKAKITDDLDDAMDIVKNVAKAINNGHADPKAAVMNLQKAFNKLESAKYYLDRE
jgi:hypothetical protein